MQVEWYGQSAFALRGEDATVAIDPFGDMSALSQVRGLQWDYPPIAGLTADLLLVTHEHRDHNAVEVIDGEPALVRSVAGTHAGPLGDVVAIASEHDGAAVSFGLLLLLPIDFPYPLFAAVLALNGLSMGMFSSPNRAAVMNSLPPGDRGAGGGMNQTFQNSAQVLSVGIFFTLMIAGLSASLPSTLYGGLTAHGVPPATAHQVAALPPVSILFAAFLGYNPIQHLVGPHVLGALSAHDRAALANPRAPKRSDR